MANKIIAKRSRTELSFDLDLNQDNQFESSQQNGFTINVNGDLATVSDGEKVLATVKTETSDHKVTISLVLIKSSSTDSNPLEKATISLVLI